MDNNLNKIDGSLKKVLLLMNYDNKKTLSENIETTNEQFGAATRKITDRGARLSASRAKTAGRVGNLSRKQEPIYDEIVKKWRQNQEKIGKTNMNPGQGTRERMIKHIQGGGTSKNFNFNSRITTSNKTKVLTPKGPKKITNNIKQALKDAGQISIKEKWNWKRWLKWGVRLGIGGSIVWWLLYDDDDILIPDDMPEEQPVDDTPSTTSVSKYKQCNGPEFGFYCVNKRFIANLQDCIGAKPDGYFGPKTLKSLQGVEGFENFTQNDTITTEQIKSICNRTQAQQTQQTQQTSGTEQEVNLFTDYDSELDDDF